MIETLELLQKLLGELIEKEKRLIDHYKKGVASLLIEEIYDLHRQIDSIVIQLIELQKDISENVMDDDATLAMIKTLDDLSRQKVKHTIIKTRRAALAAAIGAENVMRLERAYSDAFGGDDENNIDEGHSNLSGNS